MRTVLVEAAVESLSDALAAIEGGADRLELCAELEIGGTTPSPASIAAVIERVGVPVLVMIRPRGGSFVYDDSELQQMRREIEHAIELGAAGVVVGVLDAEHRVDVERMRALLDAAGERLVTFHRAFDLSRDLAASLDSLTELGVSRVLTSGGAASASEGAAQLAQLVERAGKRVTIVAGGGVRASNVRELVTRSGVHEVHLRCECDAERVRSVKAALRRG